MAALSINRCSRVGVPSRKSSPCAVRLRSNLGTSVRLAQVANKPVQTQDHKMQLSEDWLVNPRQTQPEGGLLWRRHWVPAHCLDLLDKTKPSAHTLLGVFLVLWWSPAEETWVAFEEACPHRQAALSQGRVVDGSLVCSHHGWKFGADGSCKGIPQLTPSAQEAPCASKRSCAQAYPTRQENGLLYIWLDVSPEGLATSKTSPVANTGNGPSAWTVMHFPNDYQAILEQSVDPSHAPILHHGLDGNAMSNAIPFESGAGASPAVNLMSGFTMTHGGYERRNQGMKATRKFTPPYHVMIQHAKPTSNVEAHILVVPEQPGRCLTISCAKFLPPLEQTPQDTTAPNPNGTLPSTLPTTAAELIDQSNSSPTSGKSRQPTESDTAAAGGDQKAGKIAQAPPMPWPFRIMMAVYSALPHWVTQSFAVFDQDIVIAHGIEARMSSGLNSKTYLPAATSADAGVIAMKKWCAAAEYPESLFGEKSKVQPQTVEALLDRKRMHVDDCVVCQKGFAFMNRICQVVSLASQLATTFTTALAASAWVHHSSLLPAWQPLVLSTLMSVALWRLSGSVNEFTEERFMTGSKAWARRGGLSLVKQQV